MAVLASRLDDSYGVEVQRAIAPLTIAKVTANSAIRFAPPFLATIASGLDVSLPTMGAALAVGELVGLSAPLLTRMSARLTRRVSISLGLLGIAVGAAVCATSRTAVQFAVGLVVMSATKIVFDLGIIAWLTDRVEYARLGRPLGLTETAWAGALLTGVVLMGLLTGLTSWRWGYVLAIVAIVVMAAVLRQRLPVESPPAVQPARRDRQRPQLGAGWWVIVGTFTLMASAQSMFVTFGKWLQSDFGFSDASLAAVIFALGAVELIAASLTVRFLDRWGKQRSAMFGSLLIVPAAVGLIVLHDQQVMGLALLGCYICAFEFSILATLSLSSNLVPAHPSIGLGFNVMGGTLGRAVMAPIATTAFTNEGMWLPAAIGGACAAMTSLCQWRYGSSRVRQI